MFYGCICAWLKKAFHLSPVHKTMHANINAYMLTKITAMFKKTFKGTCLKLLRVPSQYQVLRFISAISQHTRFVFSTHSHLTLREHVLHSDQ